MSQKLLLSCPRKGCMMVERTPAFIPGAYLHAVRRSEQAVRNQQFYALQYGDGIIKCSERIDTYVKSEISQLSSDII